MQGLLQMWSPARPYAVVGLGWVGAAASRWRAGVHQEAAACQWATTESGMSPVAAWSRGQYSQLLWAELMGLDGGPRRRQDPSSA